MPVDFAAVFPPHTNQSLPYFFDPFDGTPQPLQYLCVNCAPIEICLSVTCGGGYAYPALLTRIEGTCDDPYRTATHYSGYVGIGNTFVTLEMDFKIVGNDCYLVLSSVDGGLTGNEPEAQLLITQAIRDELSPPCQVCDPYPTGNIRWTVTLAGVTCTIVAGVPYNVSLIGRDDCPGCVPCTSPYGPPSNVGCGLNCQNCGCICGVACITMLVVTPHGTTIAFNGPVKICEFTYSFGSTDQYGHFTGGAIRVQSDAYGDCELALIGVSGVTLDPTAKLPQALSIGGQDNPCPSVRATFGVGLYPAGEVVILFNCSECGTCDELKFPPCCPDPLPRVLHATVDGSLCGCGPPLIIPIIDQTMTGHQNWFGNSSDGTFCGHAVFIELDCSGNSWSLGIYIGNTTSTITYSRYTYHSGSCSPMNLVFADVNPQGSGDCKCLPPFFPNCNRLTVSISE